MQCLTSGCRLLSPASTPHIAPTSRSVPRASQPRRLSILGIIVRASSDSASASTSTAEPSVEPPSASEEEVEEEEEQEVGLSPAVPALKTLITEGNILRAIAGDNVLVEDHYGRLRVNPEASTLEIIQAYRERCAEVNQSSSGESDSEEMLSKLKDSFDLLISEEERRMYDWCLLRKATHTVDYAWPYESDLTQRLDDPTSLVVAPEDDGGNRNVGLFFAGWFVLSCILSIAIGMK